MLSVQYIKKVIKISLIFLLSVIILRMFVIEPGKVDGRSMETYLIDNDKFLVDKFSLLFRAPKRGDIVQFIDTESQDLFIKRIVGLPGEIIKIEKNLIFIIDEQGREIELPEPYLTRDTITKAPETGFREYPKLAPYNYFMLGDHREESKDSRHFGPIHRSMITGKVIKL